MSEADRLRWNERHAAAPGDPGPPVARLLAHEALLRPESAAAGARALDIACGTGRHALYLASLGYTVDAWDVSDVALARLAADAASRGLGQRIRTRRVDFDDVTSEAARAGAADAGVLPGLPDLRPGAYDLVVNTYFLDRRLLPLLERLVKPRGLLFFETLLSTPERPGRPDYYLRPGELRASVPALDVLFYEEDPHEGWAALLARRSDGGKSAQQASW